MQYEVCTLPLGREHSLRNNCIYFRRKISKRIRFSLSYTPLFFHSLSLTLAKRYVKNDCEARRTKLINSRLSGSTMLSMRTIAESGKKVALNNVENRRRLFNLFSALGYRCELFLILIYLSDEGSGDGEGNDFYSYCCAEKLRRSGIDNESLQNRII